MNLILILLVTSVLGLAHGWQLEPLAEPMTRMTSMNETNTTFLVFGGFYANGTASDTVYRFTWNVANDSLVQQELPVMRLPEALAPGCVIGEPQRPYLIGGQYANGTNSTATYWWNSTHWIARASLPYHATGAACSYSPVDIRPWVAQSIPGFHGVMRYNTSANIWVAQNYTEMEHPLFCSPIFDEGLLVISGKRTVNDTFINHGFYNVAPYNVTLRIEFRGFENFSQAETMSFAFSAVYGSDSFVIAYGSKNKQYPYRLVDGDVTGGNPRMPTTRKNFAGAALLNPNNVSHVLLVTVGGESFQGTASSAVEVYLTDERRWVSTESIRPETNKVVQNVGLAVGGTFALALGGIAVFGI